ncbi:hypothetical protein Ga0102493_112924 [Erythrobacter litoralis]|uniref:Glutamate--cysteine ligase n=1 Tax=Erythrobacter litoralis TaxID=39960 RepID=A0A074NLF4_9SPHN|nr:hypothetical protein [Erythrobacter litoralis]AOL23927.1 hypothetical protein Ga0102493_112924 [Erythrobacter litoralis]KEO98592.1 hypothetical protein EH32_05665 [Erythrobacter litoralis]
MGQDVAAGGFTRADFAHFEARLAEETQALRDAFAAGQLADDGPTIGLELEAWLIDRNFFPAPFNQSFLERLGDPNVVAELSQFNIEVNAPVLGLAGRDLAAMHEHLSATMRRCAANAHEDVATVVAIGTLPTLREGDLSIEAMTPMNRYAALNREVQRARGNAPVEIDIASPEPGGERFAASYRDVMLEAATTSLQLHLQVPCDRTSLYYNASVILSAPLVAISANAPFLFGRRLWQETRIPVFEQALGGVEGPPRVSMGHGWMEPDPTAIFAENMALYPVILPDCSDESSERFPCLRLHNGTIWRWVRPIVGFGEGGRPHVRIEQRVMAAGPSVYDMMANAALYFGAVHAIAPQVERMMREMPFEAATCNFYAAAQRGLDASLVWPGETAELSARALVERLLPLAEKGLGDLGMDADLIDKYLGAIAARLASGRTGASWQLASYEKHGDFHRMLATYLENQRLGLPVHEWPL